MKKIITLALAAGMVAAAAAPASAADIKVDGTYTFQHIQKSTDYQGSKADRTYQKVDLGLTATVSENLSGYFAVRSFWDWGTNSFDSYNGTAFDGAKTDVKMRQAYIDWMIPNTVVKVRMGRHSIALPGLSQGKNPAIWWKDPVDGITVSAPVADFLDVAAFWGRYDRSGDGYLDEKGALQHKDFTTDTATSAELDVFGLSANVKFDGVKVSPFVAYASVGDGLAKGGEGSPAGQSTKMNNQWSPAGASSIFWAGFASQLTMFDPFVAKLGFVYGDRNYNDSLDTPSQHGWLVDAAVSYKTPYGTPELFAWYASGDDSDAKYATQGNLPSIGGRFNASYGYYNGSLMDENELGNTHTAAGAWGVRLGMTGISFLEGLTHDVAVVYAQGTNDKANGSLAVNAKGVNQVNRYLTSKDSFVEFDFGTTYKIYKNLTARLEAAYVLENFETKDDGNFASRADSYDDAWKVALQLQYKF